MAPEIKDALVAALATFLVALAATPLVRTLARRVGMVARPRADRWHKAPTSLLGGMAIVGSVLAGVFCFVELTSESRLVLGAASFLFVVGLVDDVVNLKPYQKLAAQVLAALPLIATGLVLPWTGSPPLNAVLTLAWLVGITNALNLLDNMDGLAAGIAAIAAATLGFHFHAAGRPEMVTLLAVFAAALAGFLAYNSNPASIFMGDCGSLFLGFFLGGAALLHPAGGRSRTFLPVLAVPILTLFIPIFDTLLVMVLRKVIGRPVSQGGRDHTSHRLVALGLSERHAVWLLYALAGASGLLAILVNDLPLDVSLASIVAFTATLSMLGFQLARVRVYDEAEIDQAMERPLVAFLVNLSYKRRVFEVALDVPLIGIALYSSHALANGPGSGDWDRFVPGLAIAVGVKLVVFLLMGVYRGLWKYAGLDNLVLYSRAVVVATAAADAPMLRLGGGPVSSWRVAVLDAILLFSLVSLSRLSLRLLRKTVPGPDAQRRRAAIYGAGDAGVLLARELSGNAALGLSPVVFLDDDPYKHGAMIQGLRVLDGRRELSELLRGLGVEEVVISTAKVSGGRLSSITAACGRAGVPVSRLRLGIEPVSIEDGAAASAQAHEVAVPAASVTLASS